MAKKKIKNGEYYTLLSATLLLRAAFYILSAGIHSALSETDWLNEINNVTSGYSGFYMLIVYDLGIGDFLLIGLLTSVMIGFNFNGKERLMKTLSVIGAGLFASVLARLIMMFAYNIPAGAVYLSIIRVIEPAVVYISVFAIITMLIFSIRIKEHRKFLKNSLLKRANAAFLIICFVLVGLYVISVLIWQNSFDNLFLSGKTSDDFYTAYDALISIEEKIQIAGYGINSLFICGTAMCFYRGAELLVKKRESETLI